jgi:hypothetical protein
MREDDYLWPDVGLPESSTDETTAAKLTASPSETAMAAVQTTARIVSPPVRKDRLSIRTPDSRLKLLQQWECVVSHVRDDCVECEMYDLTDESMPMEQAELYLEEFNHYDRPLLQEGAVFYWSIGHETSRTGQVRRYSDLRVRRMPPLSKLRKREISREAERISGLISKDNR